MSNPLISIDGENREMTDEETAIYEALCATAFRVPDSE